MHLNSCGGGKVTVLQLNSPASTRCPCPRPPLSSPFHLPGLHFFAEATQILGLRRLRLIRRAELESRSFLLVAKKLLQCLHFILKRPATPATDSALGIEQVIHINSHLTFAARHLLSRDCKELCDSVA